MPRCPRCGGNQSRPIAPGYWECQSLVTDHMETWAQAGPGAMVRETHHIQNVCGYRYHAAEGAASVTERKCWCSTFAICECARCGRPLCGDHRYWRQDRWHCGDDARAIDAEAGRAAKAAAEAVEAKEQARLERLAGFADPIERMLREIAPRPARTGNYRPDWDSLAPTIEAAGSYGRSASADSGTWASELIATWFAKHAGDVPFDVELPELGPTRRRLLGGGYTRPKVLGRYGLWLFPLGGDMGGFGCKGVGVVQDGRLVWTEAEAAGFSSGPTVLVSADSRGSYEPRYNESGLIQMARRLGY